MMFVQVNFNRRYLNGELFFKRLVDDNEEEILLSWKNVINEKLNEK